MGLSCPWRALPARCPSHCARCGARRVQRCETFCCRSLVCRPVRSLYDASKWTFLLPLNGQMAESLQRLGIFESRNLIWIPEEEKRETIESLIAVKRKKRQLLSPTEKLRMIVEEASVRQGPQNHFLYLHCPLHGGLRVGIHASHGLLLSPPEKR